MKKMTCKKALYLITACIMLIALPLAAYAAAGTVTVGIQTGEILAGTADSATFSLTTGDVPTDPAVSITWCDSGGTPLGSDPTGLSASAPDVSFVDPNYVSTVTVNATTEAVAGTYYFKATVDGADSDLATVTISSIITDLTIAGVTAPVTGATPVTTITVCDQYTGTVTWNPADATFEPGTSYTATITLTPKAGYTLTGVTADSFTLADATATNLADSGVITAVFSATDTTIATAAIAGVTAPVTGETPVSSITETSEYTATISWSPADATFEPGTVYTATITITPKAGYTLVGVTEDFFTVTDATATNAAGSGVVSAQFSATAPDITAPTLTLTSASNIASTTAKLNFTSNEAGTYYYLVYAAADVAPDAAAIKAQGTAVAKGTAAALAAANSVSVSGLSASTAYKAYVIVEDASLNASLVATIDITTTSASIGGGGGSSSSGSDDTSDVTITTGSGSTTIEGTVTTTSNSVTIEIEGSDFEDAVSGGNATFTVDLDLATITFDVTATDYINNLAASGDISISVSKVNPATLSTTVQEMVGDHPVFDFTVKADDNQVSSFNGGSVQISIPYMLKAGEDTNAIVVYYINDAGKLETVRGSYNSETGTVDFVVNHFSLYAIGYNMVSFTDVSSNAWYYNAVTYIAAREITTGTTATTYSPNDTLTRGEFLVLLMRAYGITPDKNSSNNFADAGNTYYTDYLATAKSLGITTGIGNNYFAPDQTITREDMFTLLYRALDVLDELPNANTTSLSGYSDSNNISSYATDAYELFVANGIISGSNGKLDPQGPSTRAQMAQILYNLLSE